MRSRTLALGLWALAACAPCARADEGCGAIPWSVKQEQDWFASADMPSRPSGVRLRRIDRAVDLTLTPLSAFHAFLPPATAPKAGTYAGHVTFLGVPKPGLYQVTLSAPGEIDVFENGVRIKPVAVARAADCRDAAVSGRYQLGEGDHVLVQVTGAAATSLKVGFAAAP